MLADAGPIPLHGLLPVGAAELGALVRVHDVWSSSRIDHSLVPRPHTEVAVAGSCSTLTQARSS
jgi:hypothetical protein